MKRDDNSLDSTLDRYMGQAGEPPAGQVASSVEVVWERLRPEAECSVPPAREFVTRRSHFTLAAVVVVATAAIGLYAAQRAGLLQAFLPVQQPPQQVTRAPQNPVVSVAPVRERVASGGVVESKASKEPGINSRPPAGSAAAKAGLPQRVDAGAYPLPRIDGMVYRLVVAENGSKLQDAKGGQLNRIRRTGPGQIMFSEFAIPQGLTNVLASLLDTPVLDETGLNGTYNFSLEFTDPRDTRPRQADSPPDLFTAVEEQLGLELHATKRVVPVIVVDHIEIPSLN
jgi:hypothetical protein